MKRLFGLIGYPLSHSFSPGYFAEKFLREGIQDCTYEAFPLQTISEFPAFSIAHPDLCGLNVTIPYKESIMDFLDVIDPEAQAIGAVNTIQYGMNGKLTGHNTDWIGFTHALMPGLSKWLKTPAGKKAAKGAMVLGSGGSSKAVHYALQKLGYQTCSVSRKLGSKQHISYYDVDEDLLRSHPLVINCTPLGMHPDVLGRPELPYNLMGPGNYLFDLVYNPLKTIFLIKGEQQGASVSNGLQMLYAQAEASWEIWNHPLSLH